MNKVILMGRLTRDPEVRYSQGDNSMAIARYTLAVDRRFNRKDAFRQAVIPTGTELKCTPLTLWWKIRNLRRVRTAIPARAAVLWAVGPAHRSLQGQAMVL